MPTLVQLSGTWGGSLTSAVRQPFNGADLLQERQIDVLVPDQLMECIFYLVVLAVLGGAQLQARTGAVLRQVAGTLLAIHRHKHRVTDKIAADGNAQQIEIALCDMRADGGEIKLFGLRGLGEEIGGAEDGLLRDLGTDLQHDKRGEVVGGVLDIAPDRQLEHVDDLASNAPERELHERANERNILRNKRLADEAKPGRRFLLDQSDIFVADGHGGAGLIGQLELSATLRRYKIERLRQSKRREEGLHPFEHLPGFQPLKDRLKLLVGRRLVLDLDH